MFTVVTARKALQDLLAENRVSWKDDDHFKQLTVAAGITSIGEEEIAAGMVVVDDGAPVVEDIDGRSWRLGGRHTGLLETAENSLRLLGLAQRDLATARGRKAVTAAATILGFAIDDLEKGIANNQFAARRELRETFLAALGPAPTEGDVQQTRKVLSLLLDCLPGDVTAADHKLLVLFRDWLGAAQQAYNEAPGDGDDAYRRAEDAEAEIIATSGGGSGTALAIKAYLLLCGLMQTDPSALELNVPSDVAILDELVVSLLRDAVKIVPELASLIDPGVWATERPRREMRHERARSLGPCPRSQNEGFTPLAAESVPSTSPGFADYVVQVDDDANEPRLNKGARVWLSSRRPADEGREVLIRLQDGRGFLARLIRRAEGKIVYRQHNRPGEQQIDESTIRSIDVVVLMTGHSA